MNDLPAPDADRQLYYARAADWAADRQDLLLASRRTAWWIAGLAVAVALLEALALIALTPLKTVQSFPVLVDRQTGFVQVLDPSATQRLTTDEALTRSLLAQYVMARESFDITDVRLQYRRVMLWSSGAARSAYAADMAASSPRSPFARYPRTTRLAVRVRSVSPLSADRALVRFDRRRIDAGGPRSGPTESFAAIVRYGFNRGPMRVEDRFDNPLGFQVVGYRRDPEAPSAEPL